MTSSKVDAVLFITMIILLAFFDKLPIIS